MLSEPQKGIYALRLKIVTLIAQNPKPFSPFPVRRYYGVTSNIDFHANYTSAYFIRNLFLSPIW